MTGGLARSALLALAVALWASVAAATPACGPELADAHRLDGTRYTLAYKLQPAALVVGRHFAIDFQVCAKGTAALPTQVRVDARMPEHGHGMGYRTSLQHLGAGRWRAEGLMLHMTGRWELNFELGQGPLAERLSQTLLLR